MSECVAKERIGDFHGWHQEQHLAIQILYQSFPESREQLANPDLAGKCL